MDLVNDVDRRFGVVAGSSSFSACFPQPVQLWTVGLSDCSAGPGRPSSLPLFNMRMPVSASLYLSLLFLRHAIMGPAL